MGWHHRFATPNSILEHGNDFMKFSHEQNKEKLKSKAPLQ